MKIGIVGAGISGLGAGRKLSMLGHKVAVFESENRLGGRVETRRIDDFVFDTGATTIAPRGRSLEAVMLKELDRSDLVQVQLPIFVHSSLRVSSGDSLKNRIQRYTYKSGNQKLAELLGEGLDVRLGLPIEALERTPSDRYLCGGEEFDAVILTPPAPISRAILSKLGESRPLANARYRPCLSVYLGYKAELPGIRYHALLDPEQRHPLTWLSVESAKCDGRAPKGCTALVAQLSPAFSTVHLDSDDELIYSTTLDFIERLYGKDWTKPIVRGLRRWRYSQPETTALFDRVNGNFNGVVVSGDGVMGSRVEYAYESGMRATELLVGGEESKK